jgi:MauM/NapG family ferredoxin protein
VSVLPPDAAVMAMSILRVLERLSGPEPLRPPGAVPEREFLRRCIKCNKCVQVCPYRSIRLEPLRAGRRFGTPTIDARAMPCYLCMECPPVCPTGALDRGLTEKRDVRMGVAVIDEDLCLAFHGIICRTCFDRCPLFREAITMRDEMYPEVHEDVCVGCGICVHKCVGPEGAIVIRSNHA